MNYTQNNFNIILNIIPYTFTLKIHRMLWKIENRKLKMTQSSLNPTHFHVCFIDLFLPIRFLFYIVVNMPYM